MKKTLIFDPFPAHGHVRAMIRLASIFPQKEYSIIFIGSPEFAELIKSNGYKYHVLDSLIITPVVVEIKNVGLLNFFTQCIFYPRFKRLDQELKGKAIIYDNIIDTFKPSLIFIDDHYLEKAFFYSKYSIPLISVQTMVRPDYDKNVPPFQSDIIPSNRFFSRFRINMAWTWIQVLRRFVRIKDQILTRGQTNLRYLQHRFKDSGFTITRNRCFGVEIDQIPIVNLTPKSFDLPRTIHKKDLFHLGKYKQADQVKIEDTRLSELLDRHRAYSQSGKKSYLIYVSFGTITDQFLKKSNHFYNVILRVARNFPDYQFILSIGKSQDVSNFINKPSNINIFKEVPQQSLLSKVDLVITHGGLNTIRECIQEEVPILVYPLTHKWDQPGNSARVVFHKIGLRGNIKTMNASSLLSKIQKIFYEREELKKNLHAIHIQIENELASEITAIQNFVKSLYE